MTIVEVTPKLTIAPQIATSINFSRVIANCYFEFDSFFRVQHFTRHLKFIDGADSVEMKINDGTNDNEEDTLNSIVDNRHGFTLFLPTTLLFSQRYHFVTPNDLLLNVSYVNKIAKIVSFDQAIAELIFTFNNVPGVAGTKYTLGNLVLNVVAGTPNLIGAVLTVTPDGNDDICVTVSVVDYTETFNREGFGFNTLVAGKYMPKVTALAGSDTHIVLKLKWLKADFTTYVTDWIVLQNLGETPAAGSFYLTAWHDKDIITFTNVYVGPEGNDQTYMFRTATITDTGLKAGNTIIANSLSMNIFGWSRFPDYTNDSIGQTWSFAMIPLNSNLLWYGNEVFLVYYGEARLSDNTLLLECYSHIHGSMDNRAVETTVCRTRKLTAVVYQVNGVTCSWSISAGTRIGQFDDPARRNNAGAWENHALGPLWTRTTGDFRGVGVKSAAKSFSQIMAFVNMKSNLEPLDVETCERVNIEYLIEPKLPVTLNVNDYVHFTHLMVHGTDGEFGAAIEAILGSIPAYTNYVYDHGALILNDVLGGTYYYTPHRYILAYDAGYHIVDLEFTGWIGKISGVTNPAKIMGVVGEDIAAVKDVWYIFRKSHEIEGSVVGAQTDYQVRVKIHRAGGVDSGEDVYVGTKCRADFGDIRFTESDGVTPLDYWLEGYSGGVATFWVEIPNIPADPDTVTIYIYYGKSDATTTSNGDDTFPLFIDMEDGTINEWSTQYGTATKSASTDHPHTGTYDLRLIPAGGVPSDSGVTADISAYDNNYAYRIYIYDVPTKVVNYETIALVKDGVTSTYLAARDISNFYQYVDGGWQNTTVLRTAGFHVFEFRCLLTTKSYVDDVFAFEKNLDETALTDFVARCYRANPNPSWFDDFLVRKYVEPEPAHGAWGAEEGVTWPF